MNEIVVAGVEARGLQREDPHRQRQDEHRAGFGESAGRIAEEALGPEVREEQRKDIGMHEHHPGQPRPAPSRRTRHVMRSRPVDQPRRRRNGSDRALAILLLNRVRLVGQRHVAANSHLRPPLVATAVPSRRPPTGLFPRL